MGVSAFITASFLALCVGVIFYDLRQMRIPDAISIAFVVLFGISVLVLWPEVPYFTRLLTGTGTFGLCFILFALRLMGGGDTKVIPAMALFVPLEAISQVLLLFSLALLTSIIGIQIMRYWVKDPPLNWAVLTSKKLPMGVAIGMTGFVAESVRFI